MIRIKTIQFLLHLTCQRTPEPHSFKRKIADNFYIGFIIIQNQENLQEMRQAPQSLQLLHELCCQTSPVKP